MMLQRPNTRFSRQRDSIGRQVPLYDEAGFEGMRRAGRLAAETLDFVAPHIQPGVSTASLDRLCELYMRDHGAVPATIGYRGYRHASCISLNHVVTHGIPSEDQILAEGDIVNIDVTPKLDGWHGDTNRTFRVGKVSSEAGRLIDTTHRAMMAGIEAVRPGARLGDIGHAIERVAYAGKYTLVVDFCGHGVGLVFHDAPQIVHTGPPGRGITLEPGMIFTIEPMLNIGRPEVSILADGWTTVTRDRSLSAQFEHSVGVTPDGVEIFTLSPPPQIQARL